MRKTTSLRIYFQDTLLIYRQDVDPHSNSTVKDKCLCDLVESMCGPLIKDLRMLVTEVCGQCLAASGPLLDSEGVDYG